MSAPRSRVTDQGWISVPAEIQRKLGIGPGSVLEWEVEGDQVVVRRSTPYSSDDIHRVLFGGTSVKHRTLEDLKRGIGDYIRAKHAR